MNDLTNQECRDFKGSLSNRGCYFNKNDMTLDGRNGAVSFLCHDCGGHFVMEHENLETIIVQGRKALVPVCFACNLIREEK